MSLCRQTQGDAHPGYAACLGNLGSLYQELGRYPVARPLFERALVLPAGDALETTARRELGRLRGP